MPAEATTLMHVQLNLNALRVAAPYIRAYKGGVFVVKLGGNLCEPGRVLDDLIDQLSLLAQLGIKLVVVHGGGRQATALGERLNVKPDIFAGRRITNDATLEIVKMTLGGLVNTDVVAAFRQAGVRAVGLSGVDADLITARRRPVQSLRDPSNGQTRDVDFGHVGDVERVDVSVLTHLLARDFVPVVCSLAADEAGRVLNINADTVATRIAIALCAAKYFLLTDVDGVMRDPRDPRTLLPYLDLQQLEELVRSGVVDGGMLPKLAACADAVRGGVPRVHIVNGTTSDALLGEIFTNEGCGTLLVEKRESQAEVPQPATVTT